MATGRRPRARRGTAPGLIRDAARQLFAERGYGATTREIAERAGVSHELIFRYFESKEKLFVEAVLSPLLDAIGELHRGWLDDVSQGRGSEREYIIRFATAFFDFLTDNRAIAQAMIRLLADSDDDEVVAHVRGRISATLAPMEASLEEYLSRIGMTVPDPGLQLRQMLLSIGVAANILPFTYDSDDAVPGRDEVFYVVLRSVLPMWGQALEAPDGAATGRRRR
ncbi:bacterial regulatory s, tetR family protein [Mycolicibacterium hassiacum DSM 44199]|jgi:AcrR family transcriptional regulator|uniref:Bacterial regulatory s, tetR family protein n=1 Tax=Mycolicibacterium hassiacum (strain DSM 44199 / CIP 105218 / JCM 12690 / 3849) TaxID=1122247 RepID=K5BC05_MYCHD|nr:TetR/AcrR family transcriptional regulator [Mycolicibacterium hassiacum]EKF21127.1 bacterial regulatory s, tetR family protein [Mycolicibacterium hassiacum DSM 44199]MBX5487993.1 TetR/AcrR family transcriptional regulator [Mycolicibacterium hassiacum]MDA4086351.1 hypothetical protein [Mycolicibacterium hassiacum DSM 44199]PZN19317.1 MAG: TetR/AcrR family transcriptional regulator [Mycolicibacterium hassiacum]VCT91326.1 HTH-type transcriptional repressor [Mycolicibacterium hassiacum DSM 4419